MSVKHLWELPVSSTALLEQPQFEEHPRRRYTLSFRWEGDDPDIITVTIEFVGVEAYRVTHLWSLTDDMTRSAYDRLVELPTSEWLTSSMLVTQGRPAETQLRHLRICFDDGPCYEFLCTDVQVTTSKAGSGG